jgi:Flp pilus assembly protein TadB
MKPTFQPSHHSGDYGEPISATVLILAGIGAAGTIGAGAFKYAGAKKVAAAERVSQTRDEALAKEAIKSQERVAQLQTLVGLKEQQAAERSQQYLLKGVLIVAAVVGLGYAGLKALKSNAKAEVDAEE